jgi:hypothetical protein
MKPNIYSTEHSTNINLIRRCIQKFPDWVDKEMYAYLWYYSLRSNTKGYGGKTHYTDSQNSDTTARSGKELYHLQFSLQAASPETFGCILICKQEQGQRVCNVSKKYHTHAHPCPCIKSELQYAYAVLLVFHVVSPISIRSIEKLAILSINIIRMGNLFTLFTSLQQSPSN